MTFGSEGPMVQGTWVNPTTGDSFTVRDSFFEDNQYIVTTTDGRYIRYDQLQHYIQADPKSIDGIKQAAANKIKDEPLPTEVSSLIATDDDLNIAETMITPEDYELIYGKPNKPKSLGNLNDNTRHIAPAHAHTPVMTQGTALPEDMNTAIIKKALNNTEQPKFNVVVDWNNYPTKQIEMLYDIMGISEEEILEWYLDNIQMDDVITAIKNGIKNRICSTKKPEVVEPINTTVTIDEYDAKAKTIKPKKVTKSKK
jgi:hypothetical protein